MNRAALLVLGAVLTILAGCAEESPTYGPTGSDNPIGGSSWPNDAIKANQKARMVAPVLQPTDLPPGLGDDLPPRAVSVTPPPATQPTVRND